ncbi:MAG: acetolactate synthase small subunit [Deltaproteobacteria bacterium]|nr:acetolactate synthase small subunit [Deltaproteobacteria bacterium]
MRHTISVLVENKFGVLARVSGLFSGRGFNIESLNVAPTLDPALSQMTLVTRGDDRILEQITKQLNKLINVIKVIDYSTEADFINRELVLIKVSAKAEHRAEALRIVDIFRAKVVDASHAHYTIEVTGSEGKVNGMINMLKPLGIKGIVRTGLTAMSRG